MRYEVRLSTLPVIYLSATVSCGIGIDIGCAHLGLLRWQRSFLELLSRQAVVVVHRQAVPSARKG